MRCSQVEQIFALSKKNKLPRRHILIMDDSGDDLAARGPRRVSTAPMPSRGSTEPETPDSDLVETLYSHPNVKIISFTATGRAYARSPGGPALSNVDPPSSLSWSSQLERTIAVGELTNEYLCMHRSLLSKAHRTLSHISSPKIGSLFELRFCTTTNSTKKPVLVYR